MKILKHILAVVFGTATLASFFLTTELTNDIWFNIVRASVMLIFLGLLFSYKIDHKLAESVKKAPRSAKILMVVVPLIVLIFVLIQTFWPELAVWLVRCDNPERCGIHFRHAIFVKMALQLAAAVFFGIIAYKYIKNKQVLPTILACLIVLVLILMAGEEVSWGQRIFHWSTPEFFLENNAQRETNLHNLATQLFQNALYFGGWLLLVALPFWRNNIKKLLDKFKSLSWLGEWLPPTYFLIIFAAAFGLCDSILTTDTSIRISSILFSVLATAAILIFVIIPARGILAERICLTLGVLMIALFFNLFVTEVWQLNSGVPTEYLELFINFGILYWAINLRGRLFPIRQRHH